MHSIETNEIDISSIVISSRQMQPGNDIVVAERIFKILSETYQKPKKLITQKFTISGNLHVEIELFNSKCIHTFFIE